MISFADKNTKNLPILLTKEQKFPQLRLKNDMQPTCLFGYLSIKHKKSSCQPSLVESGQEDNYSYPDNRFISLTVTGTI